MLEKIGCDFRAQGSNTYVYNIHLNDDLFATNQDSNLHKVDITGDSNISANIDAIFGKIKPNRKTRIYLGCFLAFWERMR